MSVQAVQQALHNNHSCSIVRVGLSFVCVWRFVAWFNLAGGGIVVMLQVMGQIRGLSIENSIEMLITKKVVGV